MSRTNAFSYDQTTVLRTAVDTVLRSLNFTHGPEQRNEIASLVFSIANEGDYDALALATLALEMLDDEQTRKQA